MVEIPIDLETDRMKKWTAVILALSLLFVLAACGKSPESLSLASDTTASDTASDTTGASDTTVSSDTEKETELTGETTATGGTMPSTSAQAKKTDAPKGTTAPQTGAPKKDTSVPKETTSPPVQQCNHDTTEIRNKKDATASEEGYTGDTYCKSCGKLISSGSSVPKIKQTVSATHDYYDIEMQIFSEINAERTKAGLSALVWDEGLYAGTKVRAKEYYEYSEFGTGFGAHNRPDGRNFFTAITENSSYTDTTFDCYGENCAAGLYYEYLVSDWMGSNRGHRDNILRQDFKKAAIAVYFYNNIYYATNTFVG